MTTSAQSWSWKLGLVSLLVISGAITASGESVLAQITPDTTLGNENSIVTSTGEVDSINGGATRGANLFHSFQEFNIDEGRAAVFTNPVGIENILTRVTGANPSNIFGTLGVAGGNANLFLINPNGIIFGPNARLDVGGSFVGTTANVIGFGSQGFFSATNPSNPELLTVNPSALFFNQIRATSIENSSVADSGLNPSSEFTATGLRVTDGNSLLLAGGDINMDGGGLFAFSGRVELGGLAGVGTIGLNRDGSNLSLSFPTGVQLSDVSLTNGSEVDVTGEGDGNILINARNLKISESYIDAGVDANLGSFSNQAGNITLNATGLISVADSLIGSREREGSIGNGSNINIQASSLSLTNGAALIASISGQGNGGKVNINASDAVSFDGVSSSENPSGVFSRVEPSAVGNAGDIDITTGSLSVTNGAQLAASTFGIEDAGNVTIDASDTVSLDGVSSSENPSGVFSRVEPSAVGNAGNIDITTGRLSVTNGAQLSVSSLGSGNAGNLRVATRSILLDNRGKLIAEATLGTGGNIKLLGNLLGLRRNSRVSVNSDTGDAGNISFLTGAYPTNIEI